MDFNYTELLQTTYRALISLVVLFLITKLIGKKQVSQLSLFDYVIGISIGNFAAEMTINLDSNELNGILAVVIFGVIAFLVSILTMKSMTLRRFFSGTPTLLIQNGKIMKKGLKKVKFDINDLLEVARCNGYFDISEIEFALMEANGEVSFLPKTINRPITIKDMKLKPNKDSLVANVIIDKKIMLNNLKNMGKDITWIEHELSVSGSKLEDILLATLDVSDKLTIYEEKNNEKIKNILE
ncbi:MAG TPA: DUF421 domain-containing protein [Bacilli bacterium]|nr:DUF421 domain-containing protein [Bacilli bacterium]